jgi:hypothetical protein
VRGDDPHVDPVAEVDQFILKLVDALIVRSRHRSRGLGVFTTHDPIKNILLEGTLLRHALRPTLAVDAHGKVGLLPEMRCVDTMVGRDDHGCATPHGTRAAASSPLSKGKELGAGVASSSPGAVGATPLNRAEGRGTACNGFTHLFPPLVCTARPGNGLREFVLEDVFVVRVDLSTFEGWRFARETWLHVVTSAELGGADHVRVDRTSQSLGDGDGVRRNRD